MEVNLTWDEVRLAGQIGIARRIESLKKGFGNAAYSAKGEWQVDILGALGELATAKALGVYWVPTVNTFKLPDLGQINIRATDHAGGRLIVRPKDPAGIYVLVIVQAHKCNVVGWIGAAEARRDLFKSQPDPKAPPCWAVPQEHLHPIGTIRQKIQSVQLAPAFTGAN